MKNNILKIVYKYILKFNLFRNICVFKKGDKVEYNWKAKLEIMSAIEDDLGILTVIDVFTYSDGSQTITYKNSKNEESSCDPFWIKLTTKQD